MTKREWRPGDVAVLGGLPITFFANDSHVEVMFTNGHGYQHPARILGGGVRPLVVIDPEDREQVKRLMDLFWNHGTDDCDDPVAMRAALRVLANPTPPKPEEPTGLGAVVEDADGVRWVHLSSNPGAWWRNHESECRRYAGLIAVRVLSQGVTP